MKKAPNGRISCARREVCLCPEDSRESLQVLGGVGGIISCTVERVSQEAVQKTYQEGSRFGGKFGNQSSSGGVRSLASSTAKRFVSYRSI